MEVSKDMTIAQVIQVDSGIIPILLDAGLHCLGCPSAQAESLEEASFVHGFDGQELVDKINAYLSSK